MIQPTATPVPNQGAGWGLLLLLSWLYASVVLLGGLTVVGVAFNNFDRRLPLPFQYLVVVVLLGVLTLSGFIVIVTVRAARYDLVALLTLSVYVPLLYVGVRRHHIERRRLAIITSAAMTWSLPFLLGFAVIVFSSFVTGQLSPMVTGVIAVSIVFSSTWFLERYSIVSIGENND